MNDHVLTIGRFSQIALSFLVLRWIFFFGYKILVFGLRILILDFSVLLDFDFALDFSFFEKYEWLFYTLVYRF